MDLRIDMPLILLLLLPLLIYFGWTYWRERQRLKKSHAIVLMIRMLAVGCLVFALAGLVSFITYKRRTNRVSS
ncbi:hypothetical protein AABM34_04230 [Lysinibacillus fusiformis]